MRIPFLDLRRQHLEIEAQIDSALRRALSGGVYILGDEVESFEREWSRFCGVSGAAGTNSGTDALTLALLATGAVRPGAGDEVITSPLTAGYTGLAILKAGAIPIFADIDPKTLTLDPAALPASINARTRAVVPVHLYGRMADMSGLKEVCARHGLFVVEDAAQAHGAISRGRRAGAHGHAAAFSFYPTKNLGAYGDGGAVTSDDPAVIERVKDWRQGGHAAALGGDITGLNSRLDEMQAAVLRVKLARLDGWNQSRREIAARYREAFAGTCLETLCEGEAGEHVSHLFVVRSAERERLREHLAARGVETAIHYPFLLHQQKLFRRHGQSELPVAERAVETILSLPLNPHLRADEIEHIIEATLEFKG